MKWYFCLNEGGLSSFAEPTLVAVHSALQNTTLEPHFIYDGPPNELTSYLQALGVTVHFHKSTLRDLISSAKQQDGYNPTVAHGAYLRLDIPLIDTSDDVVLYTDIDVIFLSDPVISETPAIFAVAPEYAVDTGVAVEYRPVINSGVMAINLSGFRSTRNDLIRFCEQNDFYFHGDGGFYDQGALNKFYDGQWQYLPQSMNWRPFAADPSTPVIVHMHGTKPFELHNLISGTDDYRPVARSFYEMNRAHYIMAIGLYRRFLPSDARRLLDRHLPWVRRATPRAGDKTDGPMNYKPDLFSFYFNGQRIIASHFYDNPYLEEYCQIIVRYALRGTEAHILEWGSGFTTLVASSLLLDKGATYSITSLDDYGPYQASVRASLDTGERVKMVLDDLIGPGKSQADPELNYSTWPLASKKRYSMIFIDGRRRVECGFIAALLSDADTFVVLHDFRRGRYQAMLGLFEVVEETKQFRIMKLRRSVHEALMPGREAVERALHSALN